MVTINWHVIPPSQPRELTSRVFELRKAPFPPTYRKSISHSMNWGKATQHEITFTSIKEMCSVLFCIGGIPRRAELNGFDRGYMAGVWMNGELFCVFEQSSFHENVVHSIALHSGTRWGWRSDHQRNSCCADYREAIRRSLLSWVLDPSAELFKFALSVYY